MYNSFNRVRFAGAVLAAAATAFLLQPASAQTLAYGEPQPFFPALFAPLTPQEYVVPDSVPQQAPVYEPAAPDPNESAAVPERLHRQIVDYPTHEAPGTIVVDTPHTYLYYVLGGGKAIRYGIGVGREGFTWSGVRSVGHKTEWPDWIPPREMIARQPYLPRWMAGGPGNPLGARALYIAGTQYRIHGTNDPSSIGKNVSSGCIRLLNEDIIDLYSRANIGAKVVVLPMSAKAPVIAKKHDGPVAARADRAPRASLTTGGFSGIY